MPQPREYQATSPIPNLIARHGDPILFKDTAFKADTRPEKTSMAIGYIVTEKNRLWEPSAVKKAESLVDKLTKKGKIGHPYLTPEGEEEWSGVRAFLQGTAEIVFREYSQDLFENKRLAAVGTVGASGAFSTFLDALKIHYKDTKKKRPLIITGVPEYGNHPVMYDFRGFKPKPFSHLTPDKTRYNFDAHLEAIRNAPKGSILLLQGGATHNPTGLGPENEEQWKKLAEEAQKNGCIAYFDFPYIGLDKGIKKDTAGLRIFMDQAVPVVVAVSFSKIGGLYGERTGALLVPMPDHEQQLKMQRLLNSALRVTDSSAPAYGEQVIAQIFTHPKLMKRWKKDLKNMHSLFGDRRQVLAEQLTDHSDVAQLILSGRGMYSTIPITPDGVKDLQDKYAQYMLDMGRINIGGATIAQGRIANFGRYLNESLKNYRLN